MNQLEQSRIQIDEIDRKMAELFVQRMAVTREINAYKTARQLPVFMPEREREMLSRNIAALPDQELSAYYRDFLLAILDLSKQYQTHLMGKDAVGYQGVEGAFSHIALGRVFRNVRECRYPTFQAVFEALEKGEISYGVIPFENSFTGDVGGVLDLLYRFGCHVVGMYDLKITQNLLGCPGASLSDIKVVYSHPQAIEQSRRFLENFPFRVEPFSNTALAAKFVSESGDGSLAAIAAEETAALYGLEILAPKINTSGDNVTRFIIIGKELPARGNRFSLLFTVPHTAGSLAQAIQMIGDLGFNLECIKSRPMPGHSWEYYFYVEIVGNIEENTSRKMLEKLKTICQQVRVLGVYTR